MATNFPNNPSVNDTFTSGDRIYQWDGQVWRSLSVTGGTVTEESLTPYLGKNAFVAQTPASPDPIDDEFTTSLNTTTKWTVRSGSASNAAIVAGGLRFNGALYMTQPISGTSWEVTARFCKRELTGNDDALLFVCGNTATSQAMYLGGYFKTGSYPMFYSATMPLSGGWTATISTANTANPGWINYAKLMNHRLTLASGVITYTIGEDACPESYRNPYGAGTTNTVNVSNIGGAVDVIGLWFSGSTGLIEFFRKTA